MRRYLQLEKSVVRLERHMSVKHIEEKYLIYLFAAVFVGERCDVCSQARRRCVFPLFREGQELCR